MNQFNEDNLVQDMALDQEKFVGYLKFFGPSVDEGMIDIEKIGNSLVALNKLFKKTVSKNESQNISLKLGKISKNCTEVNIFFEQLAPIAQPVAEAATWLFIAKSVGITELGKQFFGTIGQQVALKLFSKGNKVEKIKDLVENGKVYTLARNDEGVERLFLKEDYEGQKEFTTLLRDLVQLEKNKEEKMEVGYYENSKPKIIVGVEAGQKEFFYTEDGMDFETRLEEEFDESKAENIKIVGKFVDYYGMAHKYHFSFQARKNQDEIGKQKILCKTDGINVSDIIELLKPEKQEKNICISGKATRNSEDKIDKIKIDWMNEDENFNPDQFQLV